MASKMSLLLRLSRRIHCQPTRYTSLVTNRSFSSTNSFENDAKNMSQQTRHLLNELLLDEQDSSLSKTQQADVTFRKRMALAQSITLVESSAASHRQQADLLLTQLLSSHDDNREHPQDYFRVGIAGPPGAGKSSFIETFGNFLLEKESNKTVDTDSTTAAAWHPNKLAVVCIDPSSTVTGGSILGDKTRMMNLATHPRAYIRPSSNGGTFGGLSGDTHDVVSLCIKANYSLVLVESVGLGQSEVEISESVDMLVLIVPPGGGDELQGVKKGIMEVSDMVVVNKADTNLLQAARATANDYRGAMQFQRPRVNGWKTPVVLASAHTGKGVETVWNKILEFQTLLLDSKQLEDKRKRQARYWFWKHVKNEIIQQTHDDPRLRNLKESMERALDNGSITPRVAASSMLDSLIRYRHHDD